MIARAACAVLAILAPIASVAVRAQVTRDPRMTPATGTASLSGIVVSDDLDARPVRRARVTCSAPELTSGLTAVTDDRGRFNCARLPAGRYSVSVTRDGWVPAAYGAKRPLRNGTPIPIAAGQRAEIVVRMMRGGVITGTLLDENGQPAVNTGVVALRSTMQSGERRLVALGTPGLTDDRGVYRIFGLAPGDYLVGSAPHSGFPGPAGSELRATTDLDLTHARTAGAGAPPPVDRSVAFAATYFPGTPFSTQASAISLRPGEERAGVDFALQLVATSRIEGTVSTPGGGPMPPDAQLTLLASSQTAFPGVAFDGLRSAHVPPDGSFSFAGIPPGVYSLLARATLPSPRPGGGMADGTPQVLWAAAEITVDGQHISGLAVTLQPGLTVSGQVQFDGTRVRPPSDLTSIRVVAEPVQPVGGVTLAPAIASVDRYGRFLVSGVTPGRYRLNASFPGAGRPGGWVLRSSDVNGADTLDLPVLVRPNQHIEGAVITFTDHPAQLIGTLQDAAGGAGTEQTIVLFPSEPSLWLPQSRRIRAVRASADGGYKFPTLPAGDYYVAAIDDVETGEWFDPAFLQRLLPSAVKVTIARGELKVQDIRLGGADTEPAAFAKASAPMPTKGIVPPSK